MTRWHLTARMVAVVSLAAATMIGMALADGHALKPQVTVMGQEKRETTPGCMRQGEPMTYLIDFQDPDEAGRWRAINDAVMGGVSRGGLRVEGGIGIFSGETSLENNGGFASVRRDPEAFDLSEHPGLELYVRGHGRRYQLRLYTDQLSQGAAYRALLQPEAGEWQRVALPWHEFEAVFRGRRLEDAPPLDPAAIRQVGVLIADRRPGPFRLEVAWLATLEDA